MQTAKFQRSFLDQLSVPFTGEALFDCLSDVVFFIKDRQARYVVVNQTLAERCGLLDKSSLIGRTTRELFPAALSRHYQAQDEKVIAAGTPIFNQLELHLYPGGGTGWCLTQKLPLVGKQGEVVGLVGISRDLLAARMQSPDYSLVARVVKYVQLHLADPLHVRELAATVRLSPYQLDQRMRQIFQLSTAQFIQKSRLEEAMRRLLATDEAIAEIAFDCGYADHSAFTRHFRRTVGISPAVFRQSKRTVADLRV
ncbi:MAG TPA: AraC family transcriptional regulator [Pirellulales bacterium]|jgi:AraC-like DNA-binding protein|nr:AraC family transcriptional regulator [Pirellulales bacterium]